MSDRAEHVVIMGPQGAGKGTQAALVAPELRLVHISTGDLFREVRKADTELGREIRDYYDRGALVPDELTIRMLSARLDEVMQQDAGIRGALIDGFPRTQAQAEALDRMVADRGERIAAVVLVDVPRERLVERLSGRLICSNCGATYHRVFNPPKESGRCDVCGGTLEQRSDDTPEAVERRLAIYYEQTAPILDYYQTAGLLVTVNGDQPIDDVKNAITAAVRPRFSDAE